MHATQQYSSSENDLHRRIKELEAENKHLRQQVHSLRSERDLAPPEDTIETIGRVAASAPYAIFIYDLVSNHTVYTNAAAAELIGTNDDAVRSQTIADRYHPDDEFIWQSFLQRIKHLRSETAVNAEFRVRNAANQWRWYRFWVRASHVQPEDDAAQTIWIALDVTDERQSANHALSLQLERTRSNLLETFMRDATREFRTPISAINTAIYMIERQPENTDISRYVQRISKQAERLQRLFDHLMLLTRLETEQAMHPRQTRLPSIIDYVMTARSSAATERQITLNSDTVLDVQAYVHEQYLTIALQELVDNALRHTPDEGSITLSCYYTASDVYLRVSDNGSGMDAEMLHQATQRFFKASNAHSGFGLGLTIVQRIAELHGGHLNLSSQPDVGTTATIVLPIHGTL